MIGAWYIPAWNGDFRLEPHPDDPDHRTRLTIERPTADERRQLRALSTAFRDKGWVDVSSVDRMLAPGRLLRDRIDIEAPLAEIGPFVASTLKPGPNVLTAVKFRGGQIEVCETSKAVFPEPRRALPGHPYRSKESEEALVEEPPPSKSLVSAPVPEHSAPSESATESAISEPSDGSKALAKKEGAEAAVTVRRPTPCCPDCFVDEDELSRPATEVLLAFLDERQHVTWAKHRYVVTRGGATGHRYLIAHRNSPIAERNTRIAFDLDDDNVMHFHDTLVPAAEEVLAAMLILRFREAWLRNEATTFGSRRLPDGRYGRREYFKNPFGDGSDGIPDSIWTRSVGGLVAAMIDLPRPRGPRVQISNGVFVDNGWEI